MAVRQLSKSTIAQGLPRGSKFWDGTTSLSNLELISTTILNGAQSEVTFSNLNNYSSVYRHLQLRLILSNTNTTGDGDNFYMTFNSDSGANYSHHRLWANNSSVASYGSSGANVMLGGVYSRTNGTIFAAQIIDILDAYSTNKYKTIRSSIGLNATSQSVTGVNSGSWRNTNEISSIKIISVSDSFTANSRFSIYGIKV